MRSGRGRKRPEGVQKATPKRGSGTRLQKLRLKLPSGRSYPILIGKGAIDSISSSLKGSHAVIIADSGLPKLTRSLRLSLTRGGWRVDVIEVPGSERSKDLKIAIDLYTQLLRLRADRKSVIFALGGGVIGDLAGFVAGTYLRGIRWVGVPTTLLAQVDSAVGGKTGVNHPLGKNLVGVIHQPALVVCETSFLKGLGDRDRVSGLGEILKYGLTFDAKLWQELSRGSGRILALDPRPLAQAISKALKWKARIVSQDEREEKGIRDFLNFGHNIAHALEGSARYGYFRHGEAVIWGMRVESALSVVRGRLSEEAFQAVDSALSYLPVPPIPRGVRFSQIMEFIRRDKKNRDGKLRFILLKRVGAAVLDSGTQEAQIRAAFARVGVRFD